MLGFAKKFLSKYPLLQVTSYNSLSIIIKLVSSFIVSKLTAILLGTQGVTLIGNLRNALTVFQNFSTSGLNKAVVRYTGEARHDKEAYNTFISTLFVVFLVVSVIVFTTVFVFSEDLSLFIFNSNDYIFVFQWLSVLLPVYALNAYLLSVLNGLEQYKKVININILSHILNVVLFSIGVYFFGLKGAMAAVILVPSASLLFTFMLAYNYFGFKTHINFNYFSNQYLKHFGEYALMTLVSAISFPLVYLGIRVHLTNTINIDAAGYWEVTFRLSTFYLVFIQSLLNLYVLPKLVNANTNLQFRAVVFSFYKQVLPLFAVGLLLIFLLKKYVILLIASEEFLPATSLVGWQIVADFFRVIALVMVYQFHAKKMLWHYIITDLFLALALYFSAILGVQYVGLNGVVIGHAITYIVYFFIILIIFRKVIFK
jgi:PST family polysaccharide transporter